MDILDLIGDTPLVKLKNISEKIGIELYLKLEYLNPSGSIKDRIIKEIILQAETNGLLDKKKVLLEASSGNTAIALAWIGSLKGYKVKIILPKDVTKERIKILKILGADIVFTETEKDAIELAKKLYEKEPNKYFYVNQFENELNIKAHIKTALEIFKDIGVPNYVVAGIGTAGTIMGLARFFKERGSKIVGVIPEKDYEIDGLVSPYVYKQPLLEENLIDKFVKVKRKDAIKTMINLAKKEGIFAGISTGAVVYTMLNISKKLKDGKIVGIAADSLFRYLSVI